MLASCKSSYDSAAVYDDVYYTPKNNTFSTSNSSPSKSIYGGAQQSEAYQQSATPESVPIEGSEYKSYSYSGDTLPPASSQDNEYYYVEEEGDEYYDYDYASRINRFHNPGMGFGYYSPMYTGYYPGYGPSFSMNYGFGFPSSYFSLGFNYGWGGGYYNPWYYDPWYGYPGWGYPGYGWGYGGSYWSGYNHGYWNGYYAGGGGYYPGYPGGGENIYPEYYYGPRNSRGSSIVGSSSARGSRVDDGSGESEIKNYRSLRRVPGQIPVAQVRNCKILQRVSRNSETGTNAESTTTRTQRSGKACKTRFR